MKNAVAIAAGLMFVVVATAVPARDLVIPRGDLPLPAIRTGELVEQYLSEALTPLRSADTDHNGLDRGDIARKQDQEAVRLRAIAMSQFAGLDLDGDLRVTWKEVEHALHCNCAGSAADVWRRDENGDYVVTVKEVAADATRDARPDPRLERLLAMDPNGDGVLTATELMDFARQAFAKVDSDRSGDISQAEFSQADAVNIWSGDWPRQPQQNCALPSAGADAEIVAVGAYEGLGISDVTVAGHDDETNAAIVTIESGSKPVYLVLSSHDPMIWKIGGAVGRVQQVVASSSWGGRAGLPAVGVAGVNRRKVRIAGRGCLDYFYAPNDIAPRERAEAARRTQMVRAQIAAALGRAPDVTTGAYAIGHVSIPSGALSPADELSGAPPAGFDAATWRETMGPRPAPLLRFDPKTVYAAVPAERYETLPKGYGLAQLVRAGALQRVGYKRYRVVQPIRRLPPGLSGAFSVHYTVAPGVPTPTGSFGQSCVEFEDGRPVIGITCPKMMIDPNIVP